MKENTIAREIRGEQRQERIDHSREHFSECCRENRELIEAERESDQSESATVRARVTSFEPESRIVRVRVIR